MKKYSNLLTALFIAAIGFYFLYSKGLIFANFESVSPKTAYEMIKKEPSLTILDVRTPQEFKEDGHLEGALLVPVQELEKRIGELEPYKNSEILVYCRSGSRSVKASRILASKGFHPLNLKGGINMWKREALPVVR